MPFDALFLSALTRELTPKLLGARIDKIQMPVRDQVVFQFHGAGGAGRLLLSAAPGSPRMHITQAPLQNPAQPPMFCMLLRKHLSGGRITALTQPPMERLVDLTLECMDELGELVEKHLIVEMMGRGANLVLTGGDGHIIDCMRRIDFEMSDKRQILPGLFYHLPPVPDKLDPLADSEESITQALLTLEGQKRLQKWLLERYRGLSPLICRELAHRLLGDVDAELGECSLETRKALGKSLYGALQGLLQAPQPVLLLQEGKPWDFTFLPVKQYGTYVEQEQAASFSALLDEFYARRDHAERMRQKTQSLHKAMVNLRDRTARKLENQRREITAAADRERLRQLGDIVTANLHTMTRGQARLTAVDFYDPEMKEIDIPLSPQLSPQQNAAKFYKDYNRAKTAQRVLTEQIARGEGELEYLNSVLENITLAEGERDLQEIRQELTDTGYLRRQNKAAKREKRLTGRPMEFRSSTGLRISVGKNNAQNDQLTTKMAYKSDIWLHTQKIHGSHVILWLEGGEADARSLTEAAQLAAYFSQARDGSKVPVDYTPVKYVKKPAGARPGMVVYTTYQTAVVDPDPELARRLRVK